MKAKAKPRTQRQEIKELRDYIAKLSAAVVELQKHIKQLEHDKSLLVARVQRQERSPVYIPYSVPYIPPQPHPYPDTIITCNAGAI